jgi:tRNA (cytidine/uridine-2'-O-)-methyltransferase
MTSRVPPLRVVLVEPEIPGNTGSIGRICVGSGCSLHLVGKLGFSLDDRYLRRAGLDYWAKIDLHQHPTLDAVLEAYPNVPAHFLSARTGARFDRVSYPPGTLIVFGRETDGLPEALRVRFADRMVRIPTNGDIRSLNLANAAAVVMYEGLRQQGFPGLWGGE